MSSRPSTWHIPPSSGMVYKRHLEDSNAKRSKKYRLQESDTKNYIGEVIKKIHKLNRLSSDVGDMLEEVKRKKYSLKYRLEAIGRQALEKKRQVIEAKKDQILFSDDEFDGGTGDNTMPCNLDIDCILAQIDQIDIDENPEPITTWKEEELGKRFKIDLSDDEETDNFTSNFKKSCSLISFPMDDNKRQRPTKYFFTDCGKDADKYSFTFMSTKPMSPILEVDESLALSSSRKDDPVKKKTKKSKSSKVNFCRLNMRHHSYRAKGKGTATHKRSKFFFHKSKK